MPNLVLNVQKIDGVLHILYDEGALKINAFLKRALERGENKRFINEKENNYSA